MKEKKYCIQCGSELPKIARFCSSCGMLQTDEEQRFSEKPNLRHLASNSDMALSRPWHYVAPEYREFLLGLHYPIEMDFPGSSVNEVLSAGFASVGIGTISSSLESLIAARRYSELKHLDQTYPGCLPDYLHEFIEHGNTAEICKFSQDFEPKEHKLAGILLLSQVREQQGKARQHLAQLTRVYIEAVKEGGSLTQCYRNYVKRMQQGLDKLPFVSMRDLVDVAKCWGLVFGDERQARQCLQTLEIREADETECTDWLALAEGWLAIFDDAAQARRCLEQANAKAKKTSNWIDCGFHWRKLLADDRKAYQALTKAGACIPEALQSEPVTHSTYKDYLSRSARGQLYLDCARAWKFVLNEEHEALHCIEEAETAASSPYLRDPSDDWCRIADTWLKVFSDDRNAILCLGQAEEAATENSSNWCKIADIWRKLNDKHSAIRCLEQAEAAAENSRNWCEIADIWRKLNDNHNAIRCLEQAEATAEDSSDWHSCEYSWRQLKDQRKADQCRKQAEALKEVPDGDSGII